MFGVVLNNLDLKREGYDDYYYYSYYSGYGHDEETGTNWTPRRFGPSCFGCVD